METTGIKVYAPMNKTKTATLNTSFFEKQVAAYETNRFGLMTIFITIQSCMGGIASMYILQNNAESLPLCIAAMVSMGANAMMIAQASAKTCLISFYSAIIINTALILLYF